jgi:hypothetical protein
MPVHAKVDFRDNNIDLIIKLQELNLKMRYKCPQSACRKWYVERQADH